MKKGVREHVPHPRRAHRMICGRRDTGLHTVSLDHARQAKALCRKCGQRLTGFELLDVIRRQPKPGLQLLFAWGHEY